MHIDAIILVVIDGIGHLLRADAWALKTPRWASESDGPARVLCNGDFRGHTSGSRVRGRMKVRRGHDGVDFSDGLARERRYGTTFVGFGLRLQ